MRYETSGQRRVVGEGRAVASPRAKAGEEGRTAARFEPPGAHGSSLRPAHRAAVATAAAGVALRQWLDLLAPVPRMDAPRRVEAAPPTALARVELGGRDRLESRRPRQLDGGGEKGGNVIGPNPTDKGRAGCKRHLVVDAKGVPLAVRLTAANVNDCQLFEELLDAIPALKGRGPGRPRRRPAKVHADKGYDFRKCRRACRVRNMQARIARRGVESKERLGRHRWVVERDFAWFNAMRRLRTRNDRRASHYLGFLHLGCALICWNYLTRL